MITTLDEMKKFLQWCKETGIVAVKFESTGHSDFRIHPQDVVFSGTPAEGPLVDMGRKIPHETFEEGGDITMEGVTYEEGEVVKDDDPDLYGPTG